MPKKAKTPSTLRPSHPMPTRVQEDGDFQPVAVSLEGKTLAVESIDETAEEDSEWWENEPVYKMHYRVTLEGGRQLAIFRNNKTGSWYRREAFSQFTL